MRRTLMNLTLIRHSLAAVGRWVLWPYSRIRASWATGWNPRTAGDSWSPLRGESPTQFGQGPRYLCLSRLPSPSAELEAHLPRVAVQIHVHYTDLLGELLDAASRLPGTPHIFVTTTQPADTILAQVRSRFPSAMVWQSENRGKDIGPFIDALHRYDLDSYDLVLKLHGKKSLNDPQYLKAIQALFGESIRNGDDWRRGLIEPLARSTERVMGIYQAFAADPSLGMVGAAQFICRAPDANAQAYACLCEQLDVHPDVLFFAGTMFWIRGRHLTRFRKRGLKFGDFRLENSASVENTLEHGCERVFGAIVAAEGGWIGGVE